MKTLKEIKDRIDTDPLIYLLNDIADYLIAKEESEKQDLKDVYDSVNHITKVLHDRISKTESKPEIPRFIEFDASSIDDDKTSTVIVQLKNVESLVVTYNASGDIESAEIELDSEVYTLNVLPSEVPKVQAALRAFTVSETESEAGNTSTALQIAASLIRAFEDCDTLKSWEKEYLLNDLNRIVERLR